MQVGAADVTQFHVLEVCPDALVRVQIGSVARQLLEAQSFGYTLGQEVFDGLTAMNRRTVPDHQQLARNVSQQMLEEADHLGATERVVLDAEQQSTARGDATDQDRWSRVNGKRSIGGWPRGARLRTTAGSKAKPDSSTQTTVRPSRAAPFLALASARSATARRPLRCVDWRGAVASEDSSQPRATDCRRG